MSFSGLPYNKEAQMSGLEQQKHIFFFFHGSGVNRVGSFLGLRRGSLPSSSRNFWLLPFLGVPCLVEASFQSLPQWYLSLCLCISLGLQPLSPHKNISNGIEGPSYSSTALS